MNTLRNERHEGEDFESYQLRRATMNRILKIHLQKGKLFWNSSELGTYRNDGRGLCRTARGIS